MNSRTHRRSSRPYRSPRELIDHLENRLLLSVRLGHFASPPAPDGYLTTIQWDGAPTKVRNGSWLIDLSDFQSDDAARARALQAAAQLGVTVDSVQIIARGHYARIQTKSPVTEVAVGKVRSAGIGVTNIEPDRVYSFDRVPNDPLFFAQWWLDNTGQNLPPPGVIGADVHATQAWDTTIGDKSVIVADIDTGIQLDHPDLAGNIWHNPGEIPGNGIDDDGNGFVDDVTGWDFGDLDNNPSDEEGHGTSTAGCIGAIGNNNLGVSGTAWNVSILPLKIADRYGALTLAAIVGAHDYATMMRQRGTNIVASNNSYGGFNQSFYKDAPTGFSAEKDAIQRFIDSGGTFVASAGNSAYNNDDPNFTDFPASYNIPGIIAVAATDNVDGLASFSDYGAQSVDLGAPGVDTYTTTLNSGYTFISGTSFSSPITAGAVALLKSVKPNASAVEIRQAIIDSCDPLPALQGKVVSGGRLNIARALQVIGISGPLIRQISPGPVTTQTDPNTGQVIRSISITFNKPISSSFLSASAATLIRDGADNIFGTGDDLTVPIASIALSLTDPKTVVIALDLTGYPQQRLPLDNYRLTLHADNFRDTDGNFMNGTNASGQDQTYDFTVVAVTGAFEPNDTLQTATPVTFDASGNAVFAGASLGNGLFAALDVDMYRIDIPRPGEITAEVVARRLANPSSLDSYVRLFNANGVQIVANDQFYGSDSYIDYFVNTAGTYYIGVSGFGNAAYNPAVGGTGSAQSTGEYTLKLGVQLAGDDHITVGGPLAVPKPTPTQGAITDQLTVSDSRQILDVNVRLDIDHSFDGDLVISLTSPAGTTITLVNRRGGSGQNFVATLLDDEATSAIAQGAAPFTGAFRPDTPLSGFDGQSALGTWTLTIADVAAQHSGALKGWSIEFTLSNNISGPFESNDTVETAKSLFQTVVTSDSVSVNAFIGDGGFGLFDRDMFFFTVSAGATLTAIATPANGSALNTALRLFDASGTQITFSAPATSKESRFDNFVFREGGTYIIAVSERSNVNYNPFIVTSGAPAATTGDYTLNVQIAAGVSDGAMLLDGNTLQVGVSRGGTFLAPPGSVPEVTSGTAGLRWNGIEFLFDASQASATPYSFYGASASGSTFNNINTSLGNPPQFGTWVQLPVALSAESDAFNRRVVTTGLFGSLQIERTVSFGVNDSFIAMDITLSNVGAAPLSDVGWMEAFNPDQGINLSPATLDTRNDIGAGGRLATARYVNNTFQQGLTIGLAAPAADTRATVNFVSSLTTIRDPGQLLSLPVNDPNGASADDTMAIGFSFGTLDAAGGPISSVHARYFIFFGSTPGAVQALYDQVNNGTGTGHLTADAANPAPETLSDNSQVPTLPYREYYPEGYANAQTSTFVPILNPSDFSNRVIVIARYESGERDQVLADFVIPASSRSGITITTPAMYAANTLLVRKDTPYSIEVRSQTPVASTFSHYDEFILSGSRAAIGEAFTTRLSTDWTFGQVTKGGGIGDASETHDFILFTNTSDQQIKVTATFFPENGGPSVTVTRLVDPFRRGGWNINDLPELTDGQTYGVVVKGDQPIVAALSHYDGLNHSAAGYAGVPGQGTTTGVIPEGQLGVNSSDEQLGILNASSAAAAVTLSFLLSNGSTYRAVINVPSHSETIVDVGQLPAFPTGLTYSILYDSTAPVTITFQAQEFGEEGATAFQDRGFTYWGFGEGFRNPDESVVTERLKIFNPSASDTLVEITIRFDGGLGTETFRQVVPARRSVDLNVHDFVTGTRRDVLAFYGLTVKSATPVVASMDHYDAFFPGAFSTIGTPLGLSEVIS